MSDPTRSRTPADPELRAMATVVAALAPLDAEARYRVLWWVNDRYDRPEFSDRPAQTEPVAAAEGTTP